MKYLIFGILGVVLVAIIILCCFIPYYDMDIMLPYIILVALIGIIVFIALIAYYLIKIYERNKDK